ncbi:MAG: TldD/PmbA family protein [Candidatus Nitrosotenuis sp.]
MSVCSNVVSYAKKIGVDECEAVFCSKKIITIRITDSEIAEIKENFKRSVGVRLIHGKRISSLESTMLEPKKIIDDALASSQILTKREFWKSLPHDAKTTTVEKTNDAKIWEVDSARASEIAGEMISSALHQKISKISGSLNIVCEEFELENTSSLKKQEKATYISGIINADSEEGAAPVSGIGQSSSRTLEGFDAQKIGSEAAQMCVDSINPARCEPGMTSIVFEPLAVGELLTFVVGPNFGLKTYSENRSCFSEKLGEKIAADEFSLVDDPLMPNCLGTKSFDDEGVPTRKNQLVQNGTFQNTYSDSYNAFKYGSVSSGNACRPGSPFGRATDPIPVAAPHNLAIEPGSSTRDEIIRDTKKGILVSRLWYTYAVNPIKGDFSCTARSGIWIIENGRIKAPAKSVRIIHNLPVFLKNITGIADNSRTVLPWAAMPVSSPTIRCDGIPVSLI